LNYVGYPWKFHASMNAKPETNWPGNATREAVDQARFRQFVLPHLDDAFGFARWLTGNETDAENVVQEASVRALRMISSFDDGGARAWYLAIVRDTAHSWLRKNHREEIVTVASEEALTASVEAPPPSLANPIAEIDGEVLAAAVAALPGPFREALVLRDLQGLKYREIAEVLSVSVGIVMSRLVRARQRLLLNFASQPV
jgi:RNA polymerase sigma-70 factor (ECF subfamily)